MPLELTEQQRQALADRPLGPVELIDPATQRAYVLIAAEQFQRVADFLAPELDAAQPSSADIPEIPPGIRKSQLALRRDLPALLMKRKLLGQWIAYHGDERIGIAPSKVPLIEECLRRGLNDDEYYISMITPTELIEVEDIDIGFCEFDDEEDDPPAT
jgi:hypothetical protein